MPEDQLKSKGEGACIRLDQIGNFFLHLGTALGGERLWDALEEMEGEAPS